MRFKIQSTLALFTPNYNGHPENTNSSSILSKNKLQSCRLSDTNFHYYGLSLMRTLTRDPYSFCYKGSWLYWATSNSCLLLSLSCRMKRSILKTKLAIFLLAEKGLLLFVRTCYTHWWRKTNKTKKSINTIKPRKTKCTKQEKVHRFLHRGKPRKSAIFR